MRTASVCLITLAFACSGSNDEPSGAGGGAGSNGGGLGGAAGQGGTPTQAGTAMTAGTSGMATASGGSGGQGRGGGSGSGGGGGRQGGSGGVSNGGAAGASGGSSTQAGSGGGGACVPNLACKMDPPPSTGDIYQDCVDRINQFLTKCACLPALTRRTDGEACADQMAKYDADMNTPHAGARANICEPGGAQNECPGYSSNTQVIGLCMQQMWDEGPPPTSSCTGDCYEKHGHFINMTDDSVTKVACGFHTTSSGKVWAVQNFTR